MKVRCPACRAVHVDPEARFACSGCGKTLAWQAPPLWLAEQLSLFVPPGGAEPLTLPLVAPTTKAEAPRAGAPVNTNPAASLLASSVALVTACLAYPADDTVPALLADQTPEQALALAATTAWLMSSLISLVDEALDGAGTAWLQGVALGAAGG